jgi:2'-5' RNA ligase
MGCCTGPNGQDRLNQFALVTYIPDPLGQFLDELRLELAPQCNPHAHVSVLPPRPISKPWQEVVERLRTLTGEFAPFEVEAGEIAIFPVTSVIYIEIARGAGNLHAMHRVLADHDLAFPEKFEYHPHITLAQELDLADVPAAQATAVRRWKEYTGPRTFRADRVMFVQNTNSNCWVDLDELLLGKVPVSY